MSVNKVLTLTKLLSDNSVMGGVQNSELFHCLCKMEIATGPRSKDQRTRRRAYCLTCSLRSFHFVGRN